MANRDQAIVDFQEQAGVNVLIVSLKAAALGLNLVAANHVVLMDLVSDMLSRCIALWAMCNDSSPEAEAPQPCFVDKRACWRASMLIAPCWQGSKLDFMCALLKGALSCWAACT